MRSEKTPTLSREVRRNTIPEFDETVDTLVNWYPEIWNWHHTGRPSNGRIEGANNLLQVLRRTAHGFTQIVNYQARSILLI